MQRKNFIATGGTIAADRPLALDLLGVASQLVFNTFNNGHLLRLERSGDLDLAYGAARAHNRGMVEFCSVDPRLLATCYVPLADFDRAEAMAGEAIAHGRRRAARPERLPQRPLPQPHRPRPRVAPGRGGRHPDRAARRRRRAAAAPEVLRERRRLRPRLPRRRRELPLGRLHGHPRPAGADAGHDDLRRRARAAPAPEGRRDRAGRHLGAGLDAPDGVGLRRLRPPRAAPAGPEPPPERVRPRPDPRHALPHRGRALDRGAGRHRGGAVLHRLPARGGRPPPGRAVRGQPRRRCPTRCARPSTATTSSTSWARPSTALPLAAAS